MADENYGVIDASKTYTQHAIARILGVADSAGRCSQFVLNRLLKEGLPFKKIGKFYFVNGQVFCLWIQEGSASWEAWNDDTKSSDDESEGDSSADGLTRSMKPGVRKRSTRRGGAMPSN